MNTSTKVLLIHASDAEQHLSHLEAILDELKNEKRITHYQSLAAESVKESAFENLSSEDMVIAMLTNEMEADKTRIEGLLLELKKQQRKLMIVEMLVDNVVYEANFIAFPEDLQPIRSSGDMDMVWKQIGQRLRDFYPVETPEPNEVINNWSKYLKIAGVLVGLVLLFFLIRGITREDKLEAKFFSSGQEECEEVPCEIEFINESTNAENYLWDFGDGATSNEASPKHNYQNPGNFTVKLIASNKDDNDEITENIKIIQGLSSAPSANFSISTDNPCIAPCKVRFTNTSVNAERYEWKFEGATNPTSDRSNPRVTYDNPGTFEVSLWAFNNDGKRSVLTKNVEIKPSPEISIYVHLLNLSTPPIHNDDCRRLQGAIRAKITNTVTNREYRAIGSDKLWNWPGNRSNDFAFRQIPLSNIQDRYVRFSIEEQVYEQGRFAIILDPENLKRCHKAGDFSSDYHCEIRYTTIKKRAAEIRIGNLYKGGFRMPANRNGSADSHYLDLEILVSRTN